MDIGITDYQIVLERQKTLRKDMKSSDMCNFIKKKIYKLKTKLN